MKRAKRVIIKLTSEEVERHIELAKRQCMAKVEGIREKDAGYHRSKYYRSKYYRSKYYRSKYNCSIKRDRSFPHKIGMIGALGYGKHMGYTINEEIYATHGDNFDFRDIEVKTSTWMGRNIELKIKVDEYGRKKPRKYILVRVNPKNLSRVELIGEISRKRFEDLKHKRNYGNKDCWVVGEGVLDPIRKAVT